MATSETRRSSPPTDDELETWEARGCANGAEAGEEVARLITEVRRLRYRVGPPKIVHHPGRCGGDATVGETRICVWHVIALAPRYDWDLERLREGEFPDLSLEEIQLAVQYYRERPEEIEAIFRREDEARERLQPAPTVK